MREKKMSSIGVTMEKKIYKYFCKKKKSKCPKKNFQSVKKGRKKKSVSVKFRVFGKKKNWKKSSGRERKKSKWFGVEILLSSCSLVGLNVNSQVKVMEKKKKFSKYISGGW